MPKLGRRVCCLFRREELCLGLLNGKHYCLIDETSEEGFFEKGEFQYCFCPLLPVWARDEFIESLKEQGCTIKKRWRE